MRFAWTKDETAARPLIAAPYAPARWLPGSHLMTIYGRVARVPPRLAVARERLELEDGDFVDVDRFPGPSPAAPVVVVCHGLESSSRAPYVLGFARIALAAGFSVAALNFRGCSGEPNRLLRSYHAGDTADLDELVRRLVAERPGRPIVGLGFSVGGNVIARWMGHGGDALPPEVRGGAVISAPFDLGRCADALDAPGLMCRVYRERHLRTMRSKALAKARRFPGSLNSREVRAARTFRAFDELVTAPLHGFSGAEDYYRRASSAPAMSGVRRRLLLLSSTDDPLVPGDAIPLEAASANPSVTLEVHPIGGHVAFVAGMPWRPSYWAEERALAFLAEAAGL